MFQTIATNQLALVSGGAAPDINAALDAGLISAPKGVAAGGIVGAGVGAIVGGITGSMAGGVGAVPGALGGAKAGSLIGAPVGGAAAFIAGTGLHLWHQMRGR
jgi:hypothetical protein